MTAKRFAKKFLTTYRIKDVCIVMIISSPGRVVRLRELLTQQYCQNRMRKKIDVFSVIPTLGINVKINSSCRKCPPFRIICYRWLHNGNSAQCRQALRYLPLQFSTIPILLNAKSYFTGSAGSISAKHSVICIAVDKEAVCLL